MPRNAARVTTRLSGGGETHRGHVRESNQDVILVEPDLGLYAVLDGMGGANAGDVAARMAGDKLLDCVRQKSRIRRRSPHRLLQLALDTAAIEVFRAAEERLEYRGMGTTVVACLVVGPTRVIIGHAGDSRAYLLRGGELIALTRDHTVAQRLLDAGQRNIEEITRHQLTRNLGREYGVRPDVLEQALEPGDRLLLCSDGLYGGASMGAIRRVLGSRDTPDRVAHSLVALALKGRASDNISAIVIAVDGSGVRAATRRRPSRAQASSGERAPASPRRRAAARTGPRRGPPRGGGPARGG
ncbi:MAG TPA: protein phosphatase 2C domain-containing protein [Kofleriaceae bacterium]